MHHQTALNQFYTTGKFPAQISPQRFTKSMVSPIDEQSSQSFIERNVPTGEGPLAIKNVSKHEDKDMFSQQLKKISLRDKF